MSDLPEISTFVVADLAGYTALTEAHGDTRAADEAARFCDGVRGLLDDYGVEEIKAFGDALILRAPLADDGIRLAARVAGDIGARDRALGIRIGLHTGTAVCRGSDWFGSAINIASRVADLAHAGEVLMSEATRDAASESLLNAQVRGRGRRRLKNVSKPVRVFALGADEDRAIHALPVDPVCRMLVDPATGEATRFYRGTEFHFCSEACASAFDDSPQRYLRSESRSAMTLVSDDARDEAARQLAKAYAKGRLEAGELQERTELAWAARTRADLATATHDLPGRRRIRGVAWGPLWPLWFVAVRARRRARWFRERRAHRRAAS